MPPQIAVEFLFFANSLNYEGREKLPGLGRAAPGSILPIDLIANVCATARIG